MKAAIGGRSMTEVVIKLDGGKRPIVPYHSIRCHRVSDGIFGGIAKVYK
jgi:hypothetical protein